MSAATERLQAQAEILKLAHLLARTPESLAHLEAVPVADLRTLREQIIEVLWSADGAFMGKVATAARLLPASLSATISERAFGPMLSAQLAGRLEPDRAIDVAARLPTDFLADVAIELDPRRTSAVIAGIPAARIGEISALLVARGEWVTMGQFVGHLDDDALRAALEVIDGPALLRIGFVLEDKSRLERLIALMPAGRMEGIIAAAADEDLWLQALDLLTHLSAKRRRAILTSAGELDEAALDAAVATIITHELWEQAELIAAQDARLRARLSVARD